MLMQLTFILLIGGALAAALVYYRRGSGRGRLISPSEQNGWGERRAAMMGLMNPESGTLYITGISPRPDAPGEQYVTISGSISGPSVVAHEVYGRFAWDTTQWPAIGDQLPVVYPSGKPDNWQLSHPGARPYFGSKRPKDQL
ncbi:hypothetical protein [Nocardia sp. NPDC020380]|uniref:hypothetical protein n=1 Tax=Nocardia sp. NPDC020380 TaxID=3364309 RepID=UPI00378AF92C